MRRSDREITEFENIVSVMRRCEVAHIALNDEDGYPYILPLNFGMSVEDGKVVLYFHGATEGRKYELINRDCRASFEMETSLTLVAKEETMHCTMEYESVVGKGKMEMLADDEKVKALKLILAQYHPEGFPLNEKILGMTNAFKLTVESVTGKRRFMKK